MYNTLRDAFFPDSSIVAAVYQPEAVLKRAEKYLGAIQQSRSNNIQACTRVLTAAVYMHSVTKHQSWIVVMAIALSELQEQEMLADPDNPANKPQSTMFIDADDTSHSDDH